MSGTASRFQQRHGYAPTLRALSYNAGAQPSPAPAVQPPAAAPQPAVPTPAAPVPQQPTPQAPAPQQPQPAPVYAGSEPPGGGADPGPSDPYGDDEQSSPFGPGNYGTFGSVLGGLAGLATGVPGLGLAGGALGTYADVSSKNAELTSMGLPGFVDFAPAFVDNMSFGLLGRSIAEQDKDFLSTQPMDIAQQVGTRFGPVAVDDKSLPGFGTLGDFTGFTGAQSPDATPDMPEPTLDFDFSNVSYTGDKMGPDFGVGGAGGDYGGGNQSGESSGDYGAGSGAGPGGPGDSGNQGADSSGDYGWMLGGYTGAGDDAVVQPDQEAGTVHEGEHVTNAEATAYYGPELLSLLNDMAIPRSKLAALAGLG